MKAHDLDLFAAENHALVTRDAAARLGVSRAAWYRAQRAGTLEPVHRNVSRLPGSPRTFEQSVAAAVLAAQPGAQASHRTSARLLGIPRPEDDPIEILVVDRRRGLDLEGVIVHHPRDQLDLNPIRRRNILTSNVLRTLCDLGAVDPASVSAAVGHVVSTRLASPVALQRAIERHSRPGRPGTPVLRAALATWVINGKPPDSVLEPAMAKLLTKHRFPPWQFQARLLRYEVDFWIIDTPIVLECDGWEWHGKTPAQHERDANRRSELAAGGYVTVVFTYREIIKQPKVVVRRIGTALDRWTGR